MSEEPSCCGWGGCGEEGSQGMLGSAKCFVLPRCCLLCQGRQGGRPPCGIWSRRAEPAAVAAPGGRSRRASIFARLLAAVTSCEPSPHACRWPFCPSPSLAVVLPRLSRKKAAVWPPRQPHERERGVIITRSCTQTRCLLTCRLCPV